MKFLLAILDIAFIVIFWSLHLLFMAFTSLLCWFGGDCPDAMATLTSQYHWVDVLFITLLLYVTIRVWKAVLEKIGGGAQ